MPLIMQLLSLIITSVVTLVTNTFFFFFFAIFQNFTFDYYFIGSIFFKYLLSNTYVPSHSNIIPKHFLTRVSYISFQMYFLLLILTVMCVWTFVYIEMFVTISKPQMNIIPFLRLHKKTTFNIYSQVLSK